MTISAPVCPLVLARWHGGPQTPKAIVMHGTVGPDNPGQARAIAAFFARENNKTSAHYIVDPSVVIQSVLDHLVAYHCGYNHDSIAVELCDEETGSAARWADADSKAIIARAAELVARLCLAYGIEMRRPSISELRAHGPHGIYGHNDSRLAFGGTTHTDPIDFPWDLFLSEVRAAAKRLQAPAEPSQPARSRNTRITAFRTQWKHNIGDLRLLDQAVQGGRVGAVLDVRNGLVEQINRVPADSSLLREFHANFKAHRVIDLGALNTAVSNGRTGTVKDVVSKMNALVASLPAA